MSLLPYHCKNCHTTRSPSTSLIAIFYNKLEPETRKNIDGLSCNTKQDIVDKKVNVKNYLDMVGKYVNNCDKIKGCTSSILVKQEMISHNNPYKYGDINMLNDEINELNQKIDTAKNDNANITLKSPFKKILPYNSFDEIVTKLESNGSNVHVQVQSLTEENLAKHNTGTSKV